MDLGVDELMSPATLKAALAELIATGLFVFMGVASIIAMLATAGDFGGGIVIISAAHGLAYCLLIASLSGISGGHINPAVTFSMVITGRVSVVRGAIYVVAQLIGAVIGMLLLDVLLVQEVMDAIPGAGGHAINDDAVASTAAAIGLEAIITFMLVWTIFATAVNPNGQGNTAPLYIGFAVFVFHLAAIPFTGAGANPARTFGPALILGEWDDHLVYWIGPLIGAAIASLGYWLLYLQPNEDEAPV